MAFWLPSRILQAAVIICFTAVLAVLTLALRPPWLGLTLSGDTSDDTVRIIAVAPDGPSHDKVKPARLFSIAPAGAAKAAIRLDATDVIEEPDVIASYEAVRSFFARQTELAATLASGEVELRLGGDGNDGATVRIRAGSRPVTSLPSAFWVQLVTGSGALLIGAWVLALRPRDPPTQLFALSGAMIMLSAFAAAVYSSRELAIDGGLFRLLSGLNHIGAVGFGAVMICLFLIYPRKLAPRWVPGLLCGVVAVWGLANLSHALPHPQMGAQLTTMLEMLAIIVLVIAQRVAARKDARGRAVLRWLGLSVIVGALPFILLISSPVLFDTAPVLQQGHAFGFFLLIYTGLALGVSRYRLFDLDEWAFRILFYAGGLLLMLAADALLIILLQLQPTTSLALSLLAVGFAYLPLRTLLWERLVERRNVERHELFEAVVDISFTPSPAERSRLWRALLTRLFEPVDLAAVEDAGSGVAIRRDGLDLAVPAIADAPALILRYGWSGQRLFGSRDAKLAEQLVRMMRYSETSRSEFERGRTEERQRIARDLHDDVGARLLSGLHKSETGDVQRVLRDALADIRSIVGGLSAERLPLSQVLAALRHETADRLDMAGIELAWRAEDQPGTDILLDYPVYRSLISLHRELVTNVIRHANARSVAVSLALNENLLTMQVRDDGVGLPAAVDDEARSGHGLRSTRRRIAELGGTFEIAPAQRGTCIRVALPLRTPEHHAPETSASPARSP
nr:ATP-binding protein [Methylobacterium sp. ZNC0032]